MITFFLKYIPGNIYVNTSIASMAELCAYIVSGYLMSWMGVKISYIVAFVVASTGGLLMLFFFKMTSLMSVFTLLSKFGVSFAFNISYLGTPQLFPVSLTSTAFGICNVFARCFSTLSSVIAEFPDPAPMVIFSICCIVPLVLAFFLKVSPPSETSKVDETTKD